MKTYVLYHASCADGFGAAWAAWAALGDSATYLPVSYGQPLPELEPGAVVYILDFSWPFDEQAREGLAKLDQRSASLTVLDHHASARLTLQGLSFAKFESEKSGAVMAWEHFHRDKPVPELLLYVQDRDLWQWRLPMSREISAALSLYPHEFQMWSIQCDRIEELAAEGVVALKVVQRHARMQAKAARPRELGGHTVPVVNATAMVSEVCHEMLEMNGDADFVAAYRDQDGRREWSLRSRKGFDCSQIAKKFGGGGHPQACGFTQEIGVTRL